MHWFDWAAAIALVALAVRGYARGFILQLSALVAVALGVVGGLYLNSAAAGLLPDLGHPVLRLVAGFAIASVAVALAVNLLGRGLKTAVDALFLGTLDRILGAALGALVGVVLLLLVVLLIGRYLPDGMAWLEGTRTARLLSGLLERVLPLLPDSFREAFEGRGSGPQELWRRLDGLRRQGGGLLDAAGR